MTKRYGKQIIDGLQQVLPLHTTVRERLVEQAAEIFLKGIERMKNKGFGLAIAFVLALCAMIFWEIFFPIIGSSVFALILGIFLNELVDLPENSRPGLNWSGKKLLQYSIYLHGI